MPGGPSVHSIVCVALTLTSCATTQPARVSSAVLAGHDSGSALAPPSLRYEGFTMADGYRAQRVLVERYRRRGRERVGFKVAFASAAARKRWGVDEPVTGTLLDDMRLADGGAISVVGLHRPQIEGAAGW